MKNLISEGFQSTWVYLLKFETPVNILLWLIFKLTCSKNFLHPHIKHRKTWKVSYNCIKGELKYNFQFHVGKSISIYKGSLSFTGGGGGAGGRPTNFAVCLVNKANKVLK